MYGMNQLQKHQSKKASKEVLDLLMLRNAGFQKIKRDGVFITYHSQKLWYYDKDVTWQHIGEKVCVRYDRNDPSKVRIYDEEDKFLYSWECADWLITEYLNESKEKLAELGRGQADVVKQIKMRSRELKGNSNFTQKDGLKYLSKQNKGKFSIKTPKSIIPVTTSEPIQKVANGENFTEIDCSELEELRAMNDRLERDRKRSLNYGLK